MIEYKKQKDLSNIAVSLSRGKFDGNNPKKELILFITLGILIGSLIIFTVIMLSIEFINDTDKNIAEFVIALISITFGFFGIYFLSFIVMRRNRNIRKDILLWIEDAIELKAYCENIDTCKLLFVTIMKLKVTFNYEGKHFVRTSESEHRDWTNWGRPLGYFSGVSKYTDKEINILYSPKYDEIMILKKLP